MKLHFVMIAASRVV